MKTLYLIRHAKSSWKDAELRADIERPLNDRGKRDAPFMGALLRSRGIRPERLVSSPAIRAFKTAKLIGEELGIDKKDIAIRQEIYEATPYTILNIIQSFDDQWSTTALFGHNPTLTEVANWYAEEPLFNLPTCGIVAIEFPVATWQEAGFDNGKVLWVEYPKKYFPDISDHD